MLSWIKELMRETLETDWENIFQNADFEYDNFSEQQLENMANELNPDSEPNVIDHTLWLFLGKDDTAG